MSKLKIGNIVTGKVVGIERYGIFVELGSYYTGLLHISEISDSYIEDINDYAKVGDTIRAKVIGIDHENYHVKLSCKESSSRDKIFNGEEIVEVGSGFGILKDNLDEWIATKTEEINKY